MNLANSQQQKRRKLRLINLIVLLAATLTVNYQLLTKHISIQFPSFMLSNLQQFDISLSSDKIQTKLLPFPHFEIANIEIIFDNSASLHLIDTSINLDIFQLIYGEREKISSIHIAKSDLNVLDYQDKSKSNRSQKVRNALKMSESLIEKIPSYFHLTDLLFCDEFNLYVDYLSKSEPLIKAYDIVLSNKNRKENKATLNFSFTFQKWLKSNMNITVIRKANSLKADTAEIKIDTRLELDKLQEKSKDNTFNIKGNVNVKQRLSINFPVKKVLSSHDIDIESFSLKSKSTFINIKESDQTKIHTTLIADHQKVLSKVFTISYHRYNFQSKVSWIYDSKILHWYFTKRPKVKLSQLVKLVGRKFNNSTKKFLKESQGYIRLRFLAWNPWEEKVFYGSYFEFPIQQYDSFSANVPMVVSGYINGGYYGLRSKLITIKGGKSTIGLYSFKLNFKKSSQFKAKVFGKAYIEDFWQNGRGLLSVNTELRCYLYNKSLNCQKRFFNLNGKNIFVKTGAAARFYRLLSIDLTSYWKSAKPDSEVAFKNFTVRGHIRSDYLRFNETKIKSDVGNFSFNGDWRPLKQDGKFKLRVSFLNVDKLFDKIPLIGKIVKGTFDYATQLIFTLKLDKNELKVKSLTIGKGLEKLESLFQSSP